MWRQALEQDQTGMPFYGLSQWLLRGEFAEGRGGQDQVQRYPQNGAAPSSFPWEGGSHERGKQETIIAWGNWAGTQAGHVPALTPLLWPAPQDESLAP